MPFVKRLAALLVCGAFLTFSFAVTAGTYAVPLPEDALLSELLVNSPVEPQNSEHAAEHPGMNRWDYVIGLRAFESGYIPVQYVMYGDRLLSMSADEARGGDGYRSFGLRGMPDFLEGAHFVRIANDARNPEAATVAHPAAPYMIFTAAVDLVAFLGVDMRTRADAGENLALVEYLRANRDTWVFLGYDYYIINNETNGAAVHLENHNNPGMAHTLFFYDMPDPESVLFDYTGVRMFLFERHVNAGETVSIPTPGLGNPMLALMFQPIIDIEPINNGTEDPVTNETPHETPPPPANGNNEETDNNGENGEETISLGLIVALVIAGVVLLAIIILFVVKKKD